MLWLLAGLWASEVHGQAELIVRVADEGGEALTAILEGGDLTRSALLEEASRVRPALRTSPSQARRGERDWRDRVYVVTYADSASWRAARARFAQTDGVLYTQANGLYTLDRVTNTPVLDDTLDDEPFADSLDVLRVTRTVEAWSVTTGDASVRIGLLDTGLMLDHPDLAAQVWRNPGEIPDNGVDDDGNGYVDDVHGYDFVDRAVVLGPGDYREWDADVYEDGTQDHGTLTAGVMSAALDGVGMAGTAPGCPVVVLRAFGRDGTAEDDDLAAALVYAADLGVEVINLSFGRSRSSPLLQESLRYAYERGTVLVASGGNVGGDAPHYPSDYPEVIGVVWLANDGLSRASIAQHGPGIALGAPASSVLTTRLPNPERPQSFEEQLYSRVGGSSLAAPQVAGAAALLRSLDPSLSPESVRSILTATALDVGEAGWDHETGAGLLDVAAALGRPFPGRVKITSPRMDGGVSSNTAAITGSALAPDFDAYALDVAPSHDDPDGQWVRIAGPVSSQIRDATLGAWNTEGFAEGPYTLRLVVTRRDGSTQEVRHRITLDRSPPVVDLRYVGVGYDAGVAGLFVDAVADEPVRAALRVAGIGASEGDEIKREHGLFIPDARLQAGPLTGVLEVTNAAGLTTTVAVEAVLPQDRRQPGLFEVDRLAIPSGYLLPRIVDFDEDGLGEVVLNQAGAPGALGDTVAVYESGARADAALRRVVTYAVPAIPRDVGDTDGDGRAELLFQVDPITLLVEASQRRGYPDTELFRDEEGTTPTGTPLWGARLTDLDGDGRGEILGLDLRSPRFQPDADTAASTRWRVLERVGDTFPEVAVLDNTTSVSAPLDRNLYQRPYGLAADFDGDGNAEWLTGDADGDLLLFESRGDNAFDLVWTDETDRFSAGQRMAVGDFNADGVADFATFTTEFTASDIGSPAYGLLSIWSRGTGGAPKLLARTALPGSSRTDGALAAADFDGDGRDEVVVQHALQLAVFSVNVQGLSLLYHSGPDARAMEPTGFSSPQMAVGTMQPASLPTLFVSGLDGALYRFRPRTGRTDAPRWVDGFALDDARVQLAWAAETDSVAVFASVGADPFDEVARVQGGRLVLPATVRTTYALAGIRDGERGPLSALQTVRPHPPARLSEAAVLDGNQIRLAFTERMPTALDAGQFHLDEGDVAAVFTEGTRVIVRVDDVPPGTRVLRWSGLRDAEGTPVADTTAVLSIEANSPLLYIVDSFVNSNTEVSLSFSDELDPVLANDDSRYVLSPQGRVESVALDRDDPRTVLLTISGQALGAVGEAITLRATGLRSIRGADLAPDGAVVTLSEPAGNLDGVFVYPNPVRIVQHGEEVKVAGLPADADVTIFSATGAVLRSITESSGFGGVTWDLRDEQ
ncbi:MAG: S8 family serine peptidase [Bacteroidota bacterium]